MVSALTQGATTKVRNQIAGYITRICAETQAIPSVDETAEESKEEEAESA